MSYEVFKKAVEEGLIAYYGESVEVHTKEVKKNNGKILDGIEIIMGVDNNVVPVIYLNSYYDKYQAGDMSVEECVNEIISIRRYHAEPEFNYDDIISFKDYENIKDRVYPILVSTEANQDTLEQYAHREFLDLSVLYVIRVMDVGDTFGSIRISRDLFNGYGISIDELHSQAVENMASEGYKVKDMMDVFTDLLVNGEEVDDDGIDNIKMESGRMYVLSNKTKLYGAAGILSTDILQKMGRSFYIIPSSIHEMIFIPEEDGYCEDELDKMICEVNENEVLPEEVLSNHSYYYDFTHNQVRIRKCA